MEELLAYYRFADVGLVTPLKDGMNLVAKEYCACNLAEKGVLILSEFAGAAAELQRGALLVNPFDREGVADAIYRAIHMPESERRERMGKLRRTIRQHDIAWWLNCSLQASFARNLDDFSPVDQYVPIDRIEGSVTADVAASASAAELPGAREHARSVVASRRSASPINPMTT
jgi:trehalose 6-phosphate synthase